MEAERNLHKFHEFAVKDYGLALIVERGIGCGPAASASSAKPMHCPALRPVHGIPSIAGMSGLPGMDVNGPGELGTKSGVQTVV